MRKFLLKLSKFLKDAQGDKVPIVGEGNEVMVVPRT